MTTQILFIDPAPAARKQTMGLIRDAYRGATQLGRFWHVRVLLETEHGQTSRPVGTVSAGGFRALADLNNPAETRRALHRSIAAEAVNRQDTPAERRDRLKALCALRTYAHPAGSKA